VPSTELTPPQGVTEQRWLSTQASAGFHRNWTPRQRLDVSFSDWHREPLDGIGFESRSRMASMQESWALNSRVQLLMGYRLNQNRQNGFVTQNGSTITHTTDVGVRLEKRLSATRGLAISGGGGATYARVPVAAGPALTVTQPFGTGSVQLSMARGWSLTANGSREIEVLDGVSPQPFISDMFSMQLGAAPSSRIQASVVGGYSRGSALIGTTGSFEAATGSAQLQVGLSSCCGIYTSYSYYQHRLLELSEIPVGFPSQYGRHSIRVGMTVWLPLYGSF
jgi:hypothetical protein